MPNGGSFCCGLSGMPKSRRSEERRVGKGWRSWCSPESSSRRRHTRWNCDWSSDVCSSDLPAHAGLVLFAGRRRARPAGPATRRRPRRGGDASASEGLSDADIDAERRVVLLRIERNAEVEEIGRASCREGVEILVLAGVIKQKTAYEMEL